MKNDLYPKKEIIFNIYGYEIKFWTQFIMWGIVSRSEVPTKKIMAYLKSEGFLDEVEEFKKTATLDEQLTFMKYYFEE